MQILNQKKPRSETQVQGCVPSWGAAPHPAKGIISLWNPFSLRSKIESNGRRHRGNIQNSLEICYNNGKDTN